ncbi:MAG: hypothetical protein KJ579_08975 [Verrucomicrobia bacterium]|nr:hypothetical protein [Verrucomicrobiota bacterium]
MRRILNCGCVGAIAALLACGGCGGGDDGDAAAPDPAASGAEASAFAEVTPSGLAADVFTIMGRGTVLVLNCDGVAGAVSYTFVTSMGNAQTVADPEVTFDVGAAPPAGSTFSVFATNGDEVNTRIANATIN